MLKYMRIILSKTKRLAVDAIRLTGYNIISYPRPLDYTNKHYTHMLDLIYDNYEQNKLVNVNLKDCRFLHWLGYKAVANGKSPHIKAIKDYFENKCLTYENSELEAYFNKFQPANIAELMGFTHMSNEEYANMEPYCFVHPWSSEQPKVVLALRLKAEQSEERQYNKTNIICGNKYTGPIDLEKGKLEFYRYIHTARLIYNNGFKIFSDPTKNITTTFLINNDQEVRYYISSGHHRIVALAALGHEKVVICFNSNSKVVRRNEVKHWPNVINGTHTINEALNVFDMLFEGDKGPYSLCES